MVCAVIGTFFAAGIFLGAFHCKFFESLFEHLREEFFNARGKGESAPRIISAMNICVERLVEISAGGSENIFIRDFFRR